MYIASIFPPNNALTAFLRFKHNIFSEKKMLSSWALRPIVPFAVFGEKIEKPERVMLPVLPDNGLGFCELSRRQSQIYIGSDECEAFCAELYSVITGDGICSVAADDAGGFTAVPGVHLLDSREDENAVSAPYLEKCFAALSESEKHWKNCSLCLFEVEFAKDKWWERVVSERLWEVPLGTVSKRG